MIALTTVPTTRPRVAGDAKLDAKGGDLLGEGSRDADREPTQQQHRRVRRAPHDQQGCDDGSQLKQDQFPSVITITERHQEEQSERIAADCRSGKQTEDGRRHRKRTTDDIHHRLDVEDIADAGAGGNRHDPKDARNVRPLGIGGRAGSQRQFTNFHSFPFQITHDLSVGPPVSDG